MSDFAIPWTLHHLLGSSVHGILQARILEWVAISSSRGSSRPTDGTRVSCISVTGRWILSHRTAWGALPEEDSLSYSLLSPLQLACLSSFIHVINSNTMLAQVLYKLMSTSQMQSSATISILKFLMRIIENASSVCLRFAWPLL